jgi:hypothetical protein
MVAEKLRDAWTQSTGLAANAVEAENAAPNNRRDGAFIQVSAT